MLTTADRCDSRDCHAQALVRIVIPNLGELMFCGHHYTEHASRLSIYEVDDQREKILAKA